VIIRRVEQTSGIGRQALTFRRCLGPQQHSEADELMSIVTERDQAETRCL